MFNNYTIAPACRSRPLSRDNNKPCKIEVESPPFLTTFFVNRSVPCPTDSGGALSNQLMNGCMDCGRPSPIAPWGGSNKQIPEGRTKRAEDKNTLWNEAILQKETSSIEGNCPRGYKHWHTTTDFYIGFGSYSQCVCLWNIKLRVPSCSACFEPVIRRLSFLPCVDRMAIKSKKTNIYMLPDDPKRPYNPHNPDHRIGNPCPPRKT